MSRCKVLLRELGIFANFSIEKMKYLSSDLMDEARFLSIFRRIKFFGLATLLLSGILAYYFFGVNGIYVFVLTLIAIFFTIFYSLNKIKIRDV